jgi:hypothetical protein
VGIEAYGLGQWITTYRGHNIAAHYGQMPGQASYIMRLPDIGVGIAIMMNDGTSGWDLNRVIVNRMMDDLFGLDPVDWEERLMGDSFGRYTPLRALPACPLAAPAREEIIGEYFYPGYGKLTISLPKLDKQDEDHSIHQGLLDHLPKGVNKDIDTAYIGQFHQSMLYEWAVFTHLDGNIFNMTTSQFYRDPLAGDVSTGKEVQGKNGKWVITTNTPKQVVFAPGKIGFGSNFFGVYPEWQYSAKDIVEKEGQCDGVDIWFDKV